MAPGCKPKKILNLTPYALMPAEPQYNLDIPVLGLVLKPRIRGLLVPYVPLLGLPSWLSPALIFDWREALSFLITDSLNLLILIPPVSQIFRHNYNTVLSFLFQTAIHYTETHGNSKHRELFT